jgi:hypothetical protein
MQATHQDREQVVYLFPIKILIAFEKVNKIPGNLQRRSTQL